MKRLCIYVIYDRENIIDSYIEKVLEELKKNCIFLIVVCNFDNIVQGREYVAKFANKILYRRNKGFDFGAYKDVLCSLLADGELNYYDEIILSNDTYFASSYPFKNMFLKMEKQECDFWGITRHLKNEMAGVRASHIQSYFLVFRKEIVLSRSFSEYWNNLEYHDSLEKTIYHSEIGLTQFFESCGFRSMVYTDLLNLSYLNEFTDNPYIEYPYELIKDAKLPVLKIKSLSWGSYLRISSIEALYYIKHILNSDISDIMLHIERARRNQLGNVWIDINSLEHFVNTYNKIYIYGMGRWGEMVSRYFEMKGWSYVSFLETNPRDTAKSKKIEMIDIDGNVGIIIAQMMKENVQQIYTTISNYGIMHNQILMPHFN